MRQITVRGVKFMVDEDRPYWLHFWDEVEKGEWEPDTYEALDRFLNPDACFVDIGAWVGPLTIYAATKCRWVYAIEPDPDARLRLQKNLALNGIKNVTVDPRAISDRVGRATIGNRHELGNSESSLNWDSRTRGATVATTTLENFWNEHGIYYCGLVKIDTEGGEGYILPQAAEFLKAQRVPVHLALHGTWVREDQREGLRQALKLWDVVYDVNFRGDILL